MPVVLGYIEVKVLGLAQKTADPLHPALGRLLTASAFQRQHATTRKREGSVGIDRQGPPYANCEANVRP